jgi:hypothetical protein
MPVPRPQALDSVLALARGQRRTIAGVLRPNVQAWLASPEQGVSAEIESVRGADPTADALARLAPSPLIVVAAVRSDRACWAEITRHGDAESETCVAGLTYDAAGAVSRLVWLRAPFVPALAAEAKTSAPDARPIESYFADLTNSGFREAAAHFSVDTLYSHPPYAAEQNGFSSGAESALARVRHGARGKPGAPDRHRLLAAPRPGVHRGRHRGRPRRRDVLLHGRDQLYG